MQVFGQTIGAEEGISQMGAMRIGTTLAQNAQEGTADSTIEELSALTLGDWLWAGGLIVGAVLLGMVGRRLITNIVAKRADDLVARLLGRLIGLAIFSFGLVYALNQVGVSVAPLLGIIGLFGLALAFAFQDILENFIAGILMSLRRPISPGDQITTAGHSGTVDDISLRAVELTTYAGERVFIPNATVWKDSIVNHTLLGPRRTTLEVGVDYGADLEEATTVILSAIGDLPGVHSDPAPQAFVHNFGDSSIDIAVRFWHEPAIAEEWKVRDQVAKQIKRALDNAGIGIPFPQRVVTMVGGSGA